MIYCNQYCSSLLTGKKGFSGQKKTRPKKGESAMSPVQIVVVVILMAVAVLVGRLAAASAVASKRFGLKEAEAAAQYVGTADAAFRVMAVVVGTLGYENKVADDMNAVLVNTGNLNDEDYEEIADSNHKIAELNQTIAGLQSLIDSRRTELTEKKRVAALFTA